MLASARREVPDQKAFLTSPNCRKPGQPEMLACTAKTRGDVVAVSSVVLCPLSG